MLIRVSSYGQNEPIKLKSNDPWVTHNALLKAGHKLFPDGTFEGLHHEFGEPRKVKVIPSRFYARFVKAGLKPAYPGGTGSAQTDA